MQFNKNLLSFRAPEEGEPLCSGPELTMSVGQRLDLGHFHTEVDVVVRKSKLLFVFTTGGIILDCLVKIDGKQFERQSFTVTREDIGKTIFCSGFPCLTLTGINEGKEEVVVTMSEIVQQL